MQVLSDEPLSDVQVMEVLRNTPGSFEEQLIQLPCSLRPLAVLTHVAGPGAGCYSASEYPGPTPERPLLTVCVDTSQAQADLGIEHGTATSGDSDVHASFAAELTGANIRLLAARASRYHYLCFSVEQRAGSMGCCFFANSRTIQNLTTVLPDTAVVVFSDDVNLKNVTFQGMAQPSYCTPSTFHSQTHFSLLSFGPCSCSCTYCYDAVSSCHGRNMQGSRVLAGNVMCFVTTMGN